MYNFEELYCVNSKLNGVFFTKIIFCMCHVRPLPKHVLVERRVVSGGKRETVGGDKGRTERRVRDCGTTETRVCMWFWGGAPFRAAAVALIGGRCGVFSGFGQSFCPWISDEFSNALVFAGQAGFAGTRVKSVK